MFDQRGGVVFKVVVIVIALFAIGSGISDFIADQEARQRTEQIARVKADAVRHQGERDDRDRADFLKNRQSIIAEMRKAISRNDWDAAGALNDRWRAVTLDNEWNSLGAQVVRAQMAIEKKRQAAEKKRQAAADRADRERRRHEGVRIGMSQQQVVESNWGRPESVNRSIYASGVHEQWVYPGFQYLYFDNGVLTSIQTH